MADTWNLQRFVTAQNEDATWDRAVAELRNGRKRSHWMWFVFPQLQALGRSSTAKFYGLADIEEARSYFLHPVLGPRLVEAMKAMMASGATPLEILGAVDSIKLRSCASLFAVAVPDQTVFPAVIDLWYDGVPDPATLALLR